MNDKQLLKETLKGIKQYKEGEAMKDFIDDEIGFLSGMSQELVYCDTNEGQYVMRQIDKRIKELNTKKAIK